jgi:hypothetical protein
MAQRLRRVARAQEDRAHTHGFSSTLTLPVKNIAAIGCCNGQGACAGEYALDGFTDNGTDATSGLPFLQLLLCTLRTATADPVPFGTVAMFDPSIGTCPPSYTPFSEAEGRAMIAGYDSTGIVVSDTRPLAPGEDRAHAHPYSFNVKVGDVSYAGVDGCCNDELSGAGVYAIAGNTSAVSAGVPYISLLTCVSNAPTFESNFPAAALLFNQVACPPGYNLTLAGAGRFIVSNPADGVAGATMGGRSLEPLSTRNPAHGHTLGGAVETTSCQVGLASGCCADGYAANGEYAYDGAADKEPADFPYISVPLCALAA